MSRLKKLKKALKSGAVYRRADFKDWKAVDRHLKELQNDGTLTKLSRGMYYYPKQTTFGAAPAEDEKLVERFLKDRRFLLTSPNAYNSLEVGTTQLYNETVVYNHKRHGRFELGGRLFDFRMKPHFPKSLNEEFLLVDLVNNIEDLGEDTTKVLDRVKDKALLMDRKKLIKAAQNYGLVRTKKFFEETLQESSLKYAA